MWRSAIEKGLSATEINLIIDELHPSDGSCSDDETDPYSADDYCVVSALSAGNSPMTVKNSCPIACDSSSSTRTNSTHSTCINSSHTAAVDNSHTAAVDNSAEAAVVHSPTLAVGSIPTAASDCISTTAVDNSPATTVDTSPTTAVDRSSVAAVDNRPTAEEIEITLSDAEVEDVGNESDGRICCRLVRDVRISLNKNNYEPVNVIRAIKFKVIMQKKNKEQSRKLSNVECCRKRGCT